MAREKQGAKGPIRSASRWGWILLAGGGAFVLGVILLTLVAPRLLGLRDTGSQGQRPRAPEVVLAKIGRAHV